MLIETSLFVAFLRYLNDYAVHHESRSQARTLATLLILKEWDDRTGASRLWLLRRNTHWVQFGRGKEPMIFNTKTPAEDDAESVYHANIILNFMEDVALAIDHKIIAPETITEDLLPSFKLWWGRTEPLRQLVKDGRAPGWKRAAKLLKVSEVTKKSIPAGEAATLPPRRRPRTRRA